MMFVAFALGISASDTIDFQIKGKSMIRQILLPAVADAGLHLSAAMKPSDSSFTLRLPACIGTFQISNDRLDSGDSINIAGMNSRVSMEKDIIDQKMLTGSPCHPSTIIRDLEMRQAPVGRVSDIDDLEISKLGTVEGFKNDVCPSPVYYYVEWKYSSKSTSQGLIDLSSDIDIIRATQSSNILRTVGTSLSAMQGKSKLLRNVVVVNQGEGKATLDRTLFKRT